MEAFAKARAANNLGLKVVEDKMEKWVMFVFPIANANSNFQFTILANDLGMIPFHHPYDITLHIAKKFFLQAKSYSSDLIGIAILH